MPKAAALQVFLMCCCMFSLLSIITSRSRTFMEEMTSTPATSKLGRSPEFLNRDVMCNISVLDWFIFNLLEEDYAIMSEIHWHIVFCKLSLCLLGLIVIFNLLVIYLNSKITEVGEMFGLALDFPLTNLKGKITLAIQFQHIDWLMLIKIDFA